MRGFFRYFLQPLDRFILLITNFFIFLTITLSPKCQDVQLSLYSLHPLFVNPAYTGNFTGDWRFSAGYRNQQVVTAQPFQTAIASFDGHFYLLNQKLGAGLYLLNDKSGIGGLTFNKIYGSLAYETDIHNNIICIGIQGGFVSGNVNNWGNWDNTSGTFTAPNGEEYFGEKTSYADVNFGISWKRKMNKLLPQVGFSLLHLNNPNISFFEGNEKQSIQFLLDTRINIEVSDELLITPLVLFKTQSGISKSILGTDIRYTFQGKRNPVKAVFGGFHLQNGVVENASSVLVQLGTRVKRIDLAFGYEHNLGVFGESAGKIGAFEIAIVYESISTVLNSYSIPCERF